MIDLSANIGSERVFQIYRKIVKPASVIMSKETLEIMSSGDFFGAIDKMLEHEADVMELLATLEEKTIEEYKNDMNLLTLPTALMEIMKNETLMSFLSSARAGKPEKP